MIANLWQTWCTQMMWVTCKLINLLFFVSLSCWPRTHKGS